MRGLLETTGLRRHSLLYSTEHEGAELGESRPRPFLPSVAPSPVGLKTLLCRRDCPPAPEQGVYTEHTRVTLPQQPEEHTEASPHCPRLISP